MEKVWLNSYQVGVPAEINPDIYPALTTLILAACQKYKNSPCFYNMGKTITYNELEVLSRNFAAYLQTELKLKKGDRFALMLPNIIQYPVALLGCLRAGLIVVNVDPLYTPTELKYQLTDSQAKGILVLENFANILEQAVKGNDTVLEHMLVTGLGDALGTSKKLLLNFVLRKIKRVIPKWLLPQSISYTEVLKVGAKTNFVELNINSEDVAFLQYTGGTTGIAKGAILTHRNMVANVLQANAWLTRVLEPGKEIIITALPLYHIFALTANCLIFLSKGGLNVLITNPKETDSFVQVLKKFKFTAITGVNTLFNALLNHRQFARVNFSHLKLALAGGMALQPIVAKRWQQVTQKPLLEAYGLTESSPAVSINSLEATTYNGFVGLPISSTEVSIRNDDGKELGFDEAGELCIKGPQVMPGYWNRAEETKKVLCADGWLRTGDIATINRQGYIKIVDRKKDMIIVSGFKVYPNEVEGVIAELEKVKEVVVIGIKHAIKGETVKAFIVKNEETLTEAEVLEYCRKHLTAYKVPKQIEFKNELPKNNVGKILRRVLKASNV